MKAILLFLTILCFSFTPLIAEEVEIEHPNPDKEPIALIVPEDYDDLKEAYIEMAELYIGERYDLEQCLDDQQVLLDNIDTIKSEVIVELKEQLKKNEETLREIVKEKVKKDPFAIGVFLESGGVLYDSELKPYVQCMPYVQLFETFNIGVEIGYPFSLGVGLGVQF